MRKNVNYGYAPAYIPKFQDGTTLVCQVDQFPVKDSSLFKENGFPRTDIGIVERMSSLNVDRDLLNQIASRMMDTSVQSPYNGMSDDEMLRVLRPAYVQTATEYKYYVQQVYEIMSERSESVKTSDATDVSVESSTESSVGLTDNNV